MARNINPGELRLLLFFKYCGKKEKGVMSFEGKTKIHKWYFLSQVPKLLQKFLEKS